MSYQINTNSPTQQIYLNTTNCVSRSPYTFQLATRVKAPISQKMLLSLNEFTMPHTMSNVNQYNNKISFLINNLTKYAIVIPVGIYSVISFRNFLNNQLLILGLNVVCVYNHNTFKLSFVSNSPVSIINEEDYETTCGRLIGVNKNKNNEYEYPVLGNSTPTYTISFATPIDFIGTPFFFLKISEIHTDNINSIGGQNNTFARISVNAPFGNVIFYRPSTVVKFLLNQTSLNSLTVSLEDEFQRPLDIGDAEIQAVLSVQFVYPQKDVDQDAGTIPHFFKQLEIKDKRQEDDKEFGL